HVKACPEILRISGFMNGINNPELIKRLNDRVPQTFDELMKRTRSFIQGEAVAADSKKSYSKYKSQEQPRRQSNDQSSNLNNSYRNQRGGRGNDKYTPLTKTPKEILATEGANFSKPPPMRTLKEQRMGNGYCEYHGQKGHTTNECVQLRHLIDKLVKEGRLDHLVKNIKEGKDKQKVVITDQPIKQVISKPDALGRLQKWSVLLGEHNISYRQRTAVKGQILADLIIEKPDTDVAPPRSKVKLHEPWILFTDGSSCVDGSGAGLILTNLEGTEFTYALRFEFTATNNEAEYEALIAGLSIATRMGARNLEVNVDFRLVANHVLGEYVAKEDNMVQYLDKTKSLIQGFDRFTIKQQVLVEILKDKSISEMEISTVIEEQNPTWMTPIIEFISRGTLPHEQKDARRIRRKAQRFELRDGPRSVMARALRSGDYWPTMHRDAPGGLKFLIVSIDYFTKWIKAKAVATITAKIRIPTIRTTEVNVATNDDERRIDLDLLEERRERAAICEAKAKSKMKGYYDAKVRGVSFRPGDFVYRANGASYTKDA
nr:reverse transcriptase domain-containing protein [Tanacetum cinerariifolium]